MRIPRRKPPKVTANQATWSIIIGALIGVVLFLGSAYAGNSLAALIIVAGVVAWLVVLMAVGRINVFGVLWGGTVDEGEPGVNTGVVLPVTLAMVALSLGILVFDIVTGDGWGIFSWLAAALALGYLAFLGIQSGKSASPEE